MSVEQIAKVYAQALLELAREEKVETTVEEELSTVVELFSSNPSILEFFHSPLVNSEEKEKVTAKVFQAQVSSLVSNFLCYLVRKNRFEALPEVLSQFQLALDQSKKRGYLKILSKTPLAAATRDQIVQAMVKQFGKELRVEESTDPSLVGGFKLYLDDYLIDASIRHKLAIIEENLLHRKIAAGAMYEN